MSAFGDRLLSSRKLRGLSQARLAEMVGTDQSYVSEMERGKATRPTAEIVARLESALEIPSGTLGQLLASDVPIFREPIRVVTVREGDFGLRLLGSVPAGFPVESQAGFGDDWSFNEHLGGPGRFLLSVRGVSMSGDGIHDGDLVVVQADRKAEAGQIVVAKVNGEDTVKRLVKRGRGWELVSSHQDFPPIPLTRNDQAGIVGVVVGLVRLY